MVAVFHTPLIPALPYRVVPPTQILEPSRTRCIPSKRAIANSPSVAKGREAVEGKATNDRLAVVSE